MNPAQGMVKDIKLSGIITDDSSLKKTCRKHDLSFWDYLKDRLLGVGDISPLSEVIRAAAACG
jgi:hypothetical protein